MKNQSKYFLLIGVLLLGILSMTGCGRGITLQSDMQNVEQRDYATILMIEQGTSGKDYAFSLGIAKERKVGEESQTEKVVTFLANDIEELKKEYQAVKGKSLSLVHLKAILLVREEQAVLDSQWHILTLLDENNEIAKTCPVLQLTEKKKFLSYVADAKEPVGKYLYNLIKLKESEGANIPWLKDYRKVLREGTALSVYFLESEKEGWRLKCRAMVG